MNRMTNKTAKLNWTARTYDLPVLEPTIGPDVLDIRKLYGEADVFTFDPGFTSTAACESAITYIDGDKGELLYRGYPIEQLAEKSTHLESLLPAALRRTAHRRQLADFTQRVTRHTMVHEQMHYLLPRLPPRQPSDGDDGRAWSARCRPSTTTASTSTTPGSARSRRSGMIAKLPTIAAMAYKYSIGQPFVYPRNA
jgi:citrate synthase